MELDYYRRFLNAYVFKKPSHLDFWHGTPEVNSKAKKNKLSYYYMPFRQKAEYDSFFDENGVPLLNYGGKIGKQYNPIAVAQYGLGNFNLYKQTGNETLKRKALIQASWLVENLIENDKGIPVWMHNFDWNYVEKLKAPWYSGLAQGQGISLLVRIFKLTGDKKYRDTSEKAFISLTTEVEDGGVISADKEGNIWIEEYLVTPPSHILNGFIWALFGVYDFYLLTKTESVRTLFEEFIKTIEKNLYKFDTSFWSLYDLSGKNEKNLASPFYHNLHIVQLEILYKITDMEIFRKYSQKWKLYREKLTNRTRALVQKGLFKIRNF
jgi:heparosan-N-sulfate-glucuronate 5-epimerase